MIDILKKIHKEVGYLSAVSRKGSSPLDIPSLYENAVAASGYWTINAVQSYTSLTLEASRFSYPYELLDQLSEFLNVCNYSEAKRVLEELYKRLSIPVNMPNGLPEFFVRCVLIDMLTGIVSAMNQAGVKFHSYSKEYYELLFLCRSCSYEKEKNNIQKKIMELLDLFSLHEIKIMISPIDLKKVIGEYCYRSDFSITMLADYFGVSVAYMSYFVKRELEENFSDYVCSLRLEKAKKLLKTTQMSIDEVSVEVGYLNTTSFRRRFKQKMGVSPSWYRANTEQQDSGTFLKYDN